MEVVKLKPVVRTPRKTAKKAVGAVEALISAFRHPAVKESIDSALAYQRNRAAEESLAGRTKQAFDVVSDPRTLIILEVFTTILKQQLNKRTR